MLESLNNISGALRKLAEEGKDEVGLSLEQIVCLHDEMITAFGGQCGIRDQGLLESITEAPYGEYFGEVLFPTIFDKAAKYLFDFANYQVFLDGNKRTGLAAASALLIVNGIRFKDTFDALAYALVLDIANHKYNDSSEIVDILKNNCEFIKEGKDLLSEAEVKEAETYFGR